jgi:hypothetical protein
MTNLVYQSQFLLIQIKAILLLMFKIRPILLSLQAE